MKLCMWLGNADLIKQRLVDELNAMGDGARLSIEFKKWVDKRSIPQNSTYHMWLGEIAKQVNLRTDNSIDPEDLHEYMKGMYCPVRSVQLGDKHISIKSTKRLDKGEMYHYMRQIEVWAAERKIILTVPYGSDYQRVRDEQEK